MGLVSSRLKKKKPTVRDILKNVDKEIKNTQTYRKSIEKQKKHLLSTLFLYSVVLYVVAGCIIYSHQFPTSLVGCILCCGPLLAFLFVIWFLKLVLTWYFNRETERNQDHLDKLKDRKRAILDHVMKTKTFNEAEQILSEFCPGYIKNLTPIARSDSPLSENTQENSEIQHINSKKTGIISFAINSFISIFNYLLRKQPLSNNYALICKKCSTHNGLVGKQQYDNAVFQCRYCSYQNTPSKELPSSLTNKHIAPT